MKTSRKKILITGSTGFIGKNLVEYFSPRYQVLAPTHTQLDLLDKKAVQRYFKAHPVDVVLHAALYIGPKRTEFGSDMLWKNLHIFFNVTDNEKYFKRLIFFGSGAEYNRDRPLVKVREEDFGISLPQYDYGMFKFTVSKLIEAMPKVINLRLFGIYGKHEDYTRRPIAQSICRSILGLPIIIKKNIVYDYLFTEDLMRIVEHFVLHKPKYQYYNVGSGAGRDFISIADMIKKITKNPHPVRLVDKKAGPEYTCDITRLVREIPNLTFTDFEESLWKLYKMYQSKKKEIKIPK